MLKKIVIIGPECAGKSTLGNQLAAYYNSFCCPEYAREYLITHGRDYNYSDLLAIAQGQVTLEEEYIQLAEEKAFTLLESEGDFPLFIDTDMHVMKVWSEFVYGPCHDYILDQLEKRQYDLFLLCEPDLAWETDALREYPEQATRDKLFHIYRNLLQNQSIPWALINGQQRERLQSAIRAVDSLCIKAVVK